MVTAEADTTRTLVGAVLSRRWRLVHKIGDGGMGEVYAAEPVQGGSRVAIKVLRPEFLADPQVLSRFMEEARTCLRLVHPNIVRVSECATAEDRTPYMVMELLEGVPLGAYTQNGGRVPVAQAVPILQGILAGLAAAHAQGVVHRDLKPDNVFLTRGEGGVFVVKVLDFGIAKVMDSAGGMGSRTRTGMLLGTPAYMSPEQVMSARDVDERADLWSAGVMFYEMLTGRVAFPAPTEYARLTAVLTLDPEPIERIDTSLAPFAAFVARALRKEREQRFPAALEMARALAACAPHAAVLPLSRLPEVPSLFAPSLFAPSVLPGEPDTSKVATTPLSGFPATSPVEGGERKAGGTLASPAPAQDVVERAPPVLIVSPQGSLGETLPSKDLPMIRGPIVGGVAPVVVVVLVLGALAAGFLLGWAFGHTT